MKKGNKKVASRQSPVTGRPLALLSVSDKKGLAPFAKGLIKLGFDIVSSGGTAQFLKKAGVKVTEVAQLTKYPSMLGGRVKTLHPIVHGGILANRSLPDHLKDMKKFSIRPIDVVACNLYPFEATIAKPKTTLEEAVEQIDIGGPAMVRASAKNFKDVAIVVSPEDYPVILKELKDNGGKTTYETRENLALKAFRHTRNYDTAISAYLAGKFEGEEKFPADVSVNLEKLQTLRYGENPHQQAALYREKGKSAKGNITEAKQLMVRSFRSTISSIWIRPGTDRQLFRRSGRHDHQAQ